jgi:hypothetical protein
MIAVIAGKSCIDREFGSSPLKSRADTSDTTRQKRGDETSRAFLTQINA